MEIYRALFLHPSFRQKKEYKWFVLVIQEEVGRGRWCCVKAYRERFSP